MTLRRSSAVALSLFVLAGCGEDTVTPEESVPVVAMRGGDAQTGDVGAALPNPVVVSVSRDGSALAGASVSWSVTAGGGSVSPATSATGADGTASTVWTLGPTAGANRLQAAVAGATGSPVAFSATGVGGTLPTQAAVTVRDNSFDPSTTNLAVGGTITWTWAGAVDHNVTFSTGPNSVDQTSGTFSRDFPTAGTFGYQCSIHGSSMSGNVVVQ